MQEHMYVNMMQEMMLGDMARKMPDTHRLTRTV